MAFRVFEPKPFVLKAALAAEECSIGAKGNCVARPEDLLRVKIRDRVVCMVDQDTLRIGLRAMRSGEEAIAIRVTSAASKRKNKTAAVPARVRIHLAGAIRELGLELGAVTGRYTLHFKEGDPLITIGLTEARQPGEKPKGGGKT